MTNHLPKLGDLTASLTKPERSDLEQLTDSVAVADRLRILAEELIGHFVDEARAGGASWTDIGEALGVSKQAAQKRFVAGATRGGKRSLFTRFDDAARSVVVGAQEYSRDGGHDQVTTGHILLALLDDPDGVLTRAIDGRGTSIEPVREAARAALGPGDSNVPHHVSFASDAKKVLELALREAFRMQSGHIGPEHILLAVLRDEKSIGAKVLSGFGIDRQQVERAITG